LEVRRVTIEGPSSNVLGQLVPKINGLIKGLNDQVVGTVNRNLGNTNTMRVHTVVLKLIPTSPTPNENKMKLYFSHETPRFENLEYYCLLRVPLSPLRDVEPIRLVSNLANLPCVMPIILSHVESLICRSKEAGSSLKFPPQPICWIPS
jgi:hypothetical protein